MQLLPIPPVTQTLQRFIEGISPLLNETEREKTKAAAADFATNDAPILQQRLMDYAEEQAKSGQSWLTKIKLAEYLQDRRPLALSNNASLQLDYPDKAVGTARAASFIHRMVRTHIDYMSGNITPPTDPRGQPISTYNWRILTGAVREPHPEGDYYYYAANQVANRHISVLWQGHHIALQVTDAQGKVFSVESLTKALEAIINSDYDQPAFAFSAISALGSAKTAHYLDLLSKEPANRRAYDALRDSLFTFSMYHFADSSKKTELEQAETEQIQQQTFMPGNAWQFKPINYQMDLQSDFLAIHFEHSEIDGAALNHLFTYAFALELQDDGNEEKEESDLPSLQQLDWACNEHNHNEATIASIVQDIAAVTAQAKQIEVQRCTVDYSAIINKNSTNKDNSIKVSHDAMMQFALIYAQLKVFDKVRHTYEAVDTSHFMAGRTEGLRPNSHEAIALCQALLTGSATQEQLASAFTTHKQRVIACKTGQAFDRHLTGLKMMMQDSINQSDMNQAKVFFQSAGYQKLTGGDFLSTSSMGVRYPVKRILFAPTYAGGFGVNYSLGEYKYEFVLFADKESRQHLNDMCKSCIEGIDKLIELINK
ncbi:choline/carnitine O-acyltransferase [Psychrobacter fulvigenes]|uniref:choline/carnitine O-acyltransferase n=1 Tax=Psychrobacter fulvigenes TaxID=533323 RepID=UPI001919278A|nr:choline/carnitine O-acyltransferase [Psychrobacter fulvigenes]